MQPGDVVAKPAAVARGPLASASPALTSGLRNSQQQASFLPAIRFGHSGRRSSLSAIQARRCRICRPGRCGHLRGKRLELWTLATLPLTTFRTRVGVLVEVLNEVWMNVLSRVLVCWSGQVDACDDRVVESPDPLFRRRLLLESLTMLAVDAHSQVAWLAKYDVMTDEFALDFDHAFRMAEALVEEGQLGRGVLPALREIDAVLGEMSGAEDAGRWTRDSLSVDGGWSQVRRLARRVIVGELGEWQQPLPEIAVIR